MPSEKSIIHELIQIETSFSRSQLFLNMHELLEFGQTVL